MIFLKTEAGTFLQVHPLFVGRFPLYALIICNFPCDLLIVKMKFRLQALKFHWLKKNQWHYTVDCYGKNKPRVIHTQFSLTFLVHVLLNNCKVKNDRKVTQSWLLFSSLFICNLFIFNKMVTVNNNGNQSWICIHMNLITYKNVQTKNEITFIVQ